MNQICLVVPVLPGRTSDVRDFMRELETGRNADCRCIRCRAVSSFEMSGWGCLAFHGSGPLLRRGRVGVPRRCHWARFRTLAH